MLKKLIDNYSSEGNLTKKISLFREIRVAFKEAKAKFEAKVKEEKLKAKEEAETKAKEEEELKAKEKVKNDKVQNNLKKIKKVLESKDRTIEDVEALEPLVDFVEENETDEITESELFLDVIEIMEKETEDGFMSDSLLDEIEKEEPKEEDVLKPIEDDKKEREIQDD